MYAFVDTYGCFDLQVSLLPQLEHINYVPPFMRYSLRNTYVFKTQFKILCYGTLSHRGNYMYDNGILKCHGRRLLGTCSEVI